MEGLSIRNFLELNEFQNIEVIEKLEGEHNHNYVFSSNRGKFVLRKSKEHLEENNRLLSERNVLKFLEAQGIDFAPVSILYDKEKDIHVTTFVGLKDISLAELNLEELINWIQNLAEIHSLNYEEFHEFCESNGYSYNRPETLDQKVEQIKENLAEAENSDEELIEWTKHKLGKLDLKHEVNKPRLTHHDLHNSTRKSQSNLFIIDWEFSGFSYYPVEDLADILLDEHLDQEQAGFVKETYSSLSNFEVTEATIAKNKKLKLLFQLSWSLAEISRRKKNEETTEKYCKYARERKIKFESIEN